jgi:hypothetical protein
MKIPSKMKVYGPLMAAGLLLLLAGGRDRQPPTRVAAAETTPVLVELFTSEGCSSCPPADQLLRELDARQDVPGAHILVLSEHVDYWNHLGWRDTFSSPAWTARQEHYATLLRDGQVYTPEAVIDGAHAVVGSDAEALRGQIAAAAHAKKQPLSIASAEWQGNNVLVTFTGGPYPNSTIYAVLADERARSQVSAGENAGHAIEHVAVARLLVPVKNGQSSVRLAAAGARAGQERVVVFVQASDGRIVAAAERSI